MSKKYELTNETIDWRGHTLHRIRALRDFGDVRAGDIGGWVESEDNLSHEGNCWIHDEAKAYEDSRVAEDAKAYEHAEIKGYAELSGHAQAAGHAELRGRAKAYEHAEIRGYAKAYDHARLFGEAYAASEARLSGGMYATRKIVYIGGLGWPVTITDNHIKIGCEAYTTDEWDAFSDNDIAVMYPGALGFWKRWKPVIMAAALEHQKETE